MINPYEGLPASVGAYESARADIIRDLLISLGYMWAPNRPMDPVQWFNRFGERYAERVRRAQIEAALLAEWSVDNALVEQGVAASGATSLAAEAFAGTDGSHRPVLGQAYAFAGQVGGAVEGARVQGGDTSVALAEAWERAGASLMLATQTIISDTARSAKSVAMLERNTGWVRVLTPPSCSRCAVLAGKYFKSAMANFPRHPGCDCTQMPVADRDSFEFRAAFTGPGDYFESLDRAEQDKIFTKAGAQAIRDGADINQVVNARRGMKTVTDKFGYRTSVTDEGTTKRGWASKYLREGYNAKLQKTRGSRYRRVNRPRLSPEAIYNMADGDRDIALNLLHKNGYFTDASVSLDGAKSYYPRDAEMQMVAERVQSKLRTRGVSPP